MENQNKILSQSPIFNKELYLSKSKMSQESFESTDVSKVLSAIKSNQNRLQSFFYESMLQKLLEADNITQLERISKSMITQIERSTFNKK